MPDHLDGDAWPHEGSAAVAPQFEPDALAVLCRADALFSQRYEGWEWLGRGANATIVGSRVRAMDREVALKLALHLTPDESRRFVTEAHTLAGVTHPCVLRIHTAFERGTLSWIEMERVDGTTLADELRRRKACGEPWALSEALEIAACLAEGLAAVHAAGFVHRDVKPQNVLLPRGGRPAAKLADFGIARAVDATVRLEDEWAGSPRYMAPEALMPGAGAGPEVDVYGLALTLYELFSGGRSPFGQDAATRMSDVVSAHLRKAPIPLRTLRLGVPDAVVDAIHLGLAKKPKRRPSAGEIAEAIRRVQRGDHTPPVRRRRGRTLLLVLLGAMVAGVLGLVGGLAVAWMLVRP